MFNLTSLPEMADFAERKLTACQAKIFAGPMHDRNGPNGRLTTPISRGSAHRIVGRMRGNDLFKQL